MKYNILKCFLSALLAVLPFNAFSQADTLSGKQTDGNDNETKKESPHSVYTSLGFGNNMVVASTITTVQPYYYGSLIYGFNNKFFFSASTFHMPEFEPFIAYSTFGVNYSNTFSSWFDISAGAYRYQVPEALTDTLFNSFFYSDLTLGVDWRILYSRISFGGILSETSTGYLQVKNSRYFQTPEFSVKKAYFSFDPYINMLMGSMTKTVINGETVIGINSPVSGNGSGSGRGGGSGSTSTTLTSNYFGLMEIDFGLPVAFNIGNLTLEVEPGYVLPMYTDPEIPSPDGFTIMLNCFIKIF